MVEIQVALDFINKEDALRVTSKIYDFDNVILEAGTPLIKAEGITVLRELKQKFPDKPLLADMKTMDVGDIEAKLAFANGAEYTTVLGVANRETIEKVIEVAKEYNAKVVVDLIGVQDIKSFLVKIKGLNPDILCIHRGIDVEKSLKEGKKYDIKELINFLKRNTNYKIAVAGGINDTTAPLYVEYGADILVIGRYITKSSDPRSALQRIYTVLKSKS